MSRVVVIGGNAAGLSAASQIKRLQPEWKVSVLEKGEYISYGACGIPYFLEGLVPNVGELISVTPEDAINKRGLDLHTGVEVVGIDAENKRVKVNNGKDTEQLVFDYLALCTGASAVTTGIEVKGSRGIFTVHNLQDALGVEEFIQKNSPSKVAVIGGGFIAVEMVEAFQQRGLETHLVHRRDSLAKNLEKEISDALLQEMDNKGVILNLNQSVDIVEAVDSVEGAGDREANENAAGRGVIVHTGAGPLAFDLVIIATGVQPNTELAQEIGIELGVKNAIKTDEYMRTNYEFIYAAGDCTQTFNRITGQPAYAPLALKANRQGFVAGVNVAGGKEQFPGITETAVTKAFDLGAARTGLTREGAEKAGFDPYQVEVTTGSRAHYYPGSGRLQSVLIADSKTKRLLGAQLAGPVEAVKRIDVYATAIAANMTVDDIFNLDLAYAPPFAPVYDPVITASRVARKQS